MQTLLLSLLLFSPAEARKPKSLTVVVQDRTGEPVPSAIIVFTTEREEHALNSVTGGWEGNMLYLPDGREIVFEKGVRVTAVAAAPGYRPSTWDAVIDGKRTEVYMILEPVAAPALPCVPDEITGALPVFDWSSKQLGVDEVRGKEAAWCLLGARAWSASQIWQDRRKEYLAEATERSFGQQADAREQAREAALAWLEWSRSNDADIATAETLCQTASKRLDGCR